MHKKYVTKRSFADSSRMGNLQLPSPKPGDKDTLVIDGFPLHACFGNIFQPIPEYMSFIPQEAASSSSSSASPTFEPRTLALAPAPAAAATEWVPLMSNFPSGQVLSQWIRGGGHYPNSGVDLASFKGGDVCMVARDDCDGAEVDLSIRHAVAYRYNKDDVNITTDIDLIAQAAPEGSLLVMPAIGTNNGVSYAEAASKMFYSIVSALNSEPSPVRNRLRGILFLSPCEGAGARTISHIINLFEIYRETRDEPDCPVCFELKQDMVISCGHRFCCRCILALPQHGGLCPTCRAPIRHMAPCHKLIDSSDFNCCAEEKRPGSPEGEAPAPAGPIEKAPAAPKPEDGDAGAAPAAPEPEEKKKEGEEGVAAAAAPEETKTKDPFIYVPCGHFKSLCVDCSKKEISCRGSHASKGLCKVCGEPVMAYLRIYS